MKYDRLEEKGFTLIAKGHKPLCMANGRLLTYKKSSLFFYENGRFKQIASFPCSWRDKLFNRMRILTRIARSEPQGAIATEDMIYIARHESIDCILQSDGSVLSSVPFRKPYIHTNMLVDVSEVQGFEDCIAYGEYFPNAKREKVCIYTQKKGSYGEWEQVFAFPDGAVRHIHSLVPDPQNHCVYILTGDENAESGIWRATERFQKVEAVLTGDQMYRSCLMFVCNNSLIYATDIPSRQNFIASVDLATGEWKKLVDIPGTCTVGCRAGNKFIFCTSVEAEEPKNRKKITMIRYLLSKKLATGIKDTYPRMYISEDREKYTEYLRLKKDFWPGGLCRFGRVLPLFDSATSTLYVFPTAVKKYDGKLYMKIIQDLTEKSNTV